MQYTDYIKSYNDRVEREQQLVAKYSQTPIINRHKGLWMATTMSKHTKHKLDVIEAILGVLMAGGIIVASVLIG